MELHDIPAGAVVVGIDGSHHADEALDWAARHAASESRPLVLLHCVGGNGTPSSWMAQAGIDPTQYLTDAETSGHALLDLAGAHAGRVTGDDPFLVLTRTDPRSAFIELSSRVAVIVMGSRGRGPVSSLLLGSVSAGVAGNANCPVVVVRPQHSSLAPGVQHRGVLVGVDGTAASLPVLEFAYLQAAELGLPLTVLHALYDSRAVAEGRDEAWAEVVDDKQAGLLLAESIAGFGEKFPEVHVERKVRRGTAVPELVALGDAMDLIIVGHRQRNALDRAIYGSVAMGVLEHAATTVAVVPQH